MDLSTRVENIANEHLQDSDGTTEELLRRLEQKLERQHEALQHTQDEIGAKASTLRSLANSTIKDLAGKYPSLCE